MRQIVARFAGRAPLLANMVEGGQTPQRSAQQLAEIGYGLVIFPGGLVRALAHCAQAYLASLGEHGTTQPFSDRMLDFDGLNDVLGTEETLRMGQRYAGNFEAGHD